MKPVFHTIANDALECVLTPPGASIVSVTLKLPSGERRLVSLSPDAFKTDAAEPAMAGRCIAPCCGRIRGASFTSGGEAFTFTKNEGENHLHGGIHAAQFQSWNIVRTDKNCVTYGLTLPDGLDGYPGERTFEVTYRLDGNALTLEWTAETTSPSPIDLTNHVYWDLTGRFDGSAMDQTLTTDADTYVRNGSDHVPKEIVPAAGTAFDFSTAMTFRERMQTFDDEQLSIARGFNNAVIFRGSNCCLKLSAPNGGPVMRMTTSRPCVVVYTGGFLGADTRLPSGAACPGCAVALEAQSIPDEAHISPETFRLCRPGEKIKNFISWKFE